MHRIFTHTLCLICFTLVLPLSAEAQRLYGNEWIEPCQVYFRIPVSKTGIYKISTAELHRYRVPVDEIPAASLQMFRRGKELAIETTTDESGRLGNDGYLIFYGEKNDGAADSLLYTSPAAMPHSYYSLYSDTAAYFLTWKMDGTVGKRMLVNDPEIQSDTVGYHVEESLQLFNSHYLPGPFYPTGSNFETGSVVTAYDTGEGWTGPELKENQSYETSVQTENAVKNHFEKASIEILLAGWSPGQHSFELWTGSIKNPLRKLTNIDFLDNNTVKIHVEMLLSDLEKDNKVNFTLVPLGKGGHISVSYLKLKYRQKSNTQPEETMHVHSCQPVKFHHTNPLLTDYLIISHPLMRLPIDGTDPVTAYADYRASTAGGSYKPLIVHSSEVYDEFNYGDPGPQGIKNMITWLHQKGSLKFVFLIGRSIDPQKARKLPDAGQVDMVPNAGWPGSDIALVMATNPDSADWPTVPIGRINALNAQQVHDYLQKVKAMEAELSRSPWRKKILHLSGGRSRGELALFKSYVKSFEQKIQNTALAASVVTISKETDDPVEKLPVYEPVNKGVALMTLFGHSGLDVTDIDIGLASDPASRYQNHPHYPAVIVNGCASGSIFHSTKTLSSDWIFAPKSGAVLFLAHTFNGVSTSLKRYTDIFYEVLADSNFTSAPFGIIQQEAIKRNMLRKPAILDKITVQQMNLHGDPAIRIFPARLPEADAIDSSAIADDTTPVLLVTIDQRQITDFECVSDQPTLGIELIGHDESEVQRDTSGITIWMKKKCQGCGEKRIYLNHAICKNISPGHSYLELTLPAPLETGTYHVTVQARDRNRNFAPDYDINFKVSDSDTLINVSVFPNPSTEWFRFAADFEGLSISQNMTLTIHDSYGRKVKESVFKPRIGKNEWYWAPERLPAGLYFYSIKSEQNSGSQSLKTVKTIKGKLIRVN
ncbi:MAG: C25 family cysteine peptidase [Dyadobacter sp.]|uniref:putative type IX secretion system sortase PorU2 n=1 Tax=Dyadobacter sp. TaxID=1914288 RepID=UPI003263E34D